MTGLLPWIVKAALGGAYWLGCLYVATGLFAGDRVEVSGDEISEGQRVVVPNR